MQKRTLVPILSIILLLTSAMDSAAVTRVARKLNVIEFSAGSGIPWGEYDRLRPFDFIINNRFVKIDADAVYDPSLHLAVSYGQLVGGRFLLTVGIRYTDVNTVDTINLPLDTFFVPDENIAGIKWTQYDLDVNFNYYIADISKMSFAPYGGVGLSAGLNRFSSDLFEAEYEATFALNLNFGLDIRLGSGSSGKSFLTLSSVNSWNAYASGHRPKYLNIGGALKFWFKP